MSRIGKMPIAVPAGVDVKIDGPVVIDAIIDQDDKVWPMVAPGAPISEAFTDEDMKNKENN